MKNYNRKKNQKIMKTNILFLFPLLFSSFLTAQDTLKEQNSVMYSKYYVIKRDNSFELFFHHCTGLTYGRGKVKKGIRCWKFEYDSLNLQVPHSVCEETASTLSDSINVIIRSITDQHEFTPVLIQINNKKLGFDSNKHLSKDEITSDSIQVIYQRDTFYIRHDWRNCAELTLYLNDNFTTYVSGGTDKLRKRKNEFYLNSFVRIMNEEKYWKKGRRKKVVHSYAYN